MRSVWAGVGVEGRRLWEGVVGLIGWSEFFYFTVLSVDSGSGSGWARREERLLAVKAAILSLLDALLYLGMYGAEDTGGRWIWALDNPSSSFLEELADALSEKKGFKPTKKLA